ncbi:MAG: MFS transporter [Chloroflexota bacterium]
MTTTTVSQTSTQKFNYQEVVSITSGHFIHDTFTAFLPPLLPLLIEKLSLSLTLAGALTTFSQYPAILTPFIGYLADKLSLRYFVIFAPAITATFSSLLGLAPNYALLALLLLVVGISSAVFHAPAPAMIAQVSGDQVGKGMSFFMAGGELGRTVGPILAVWTVSMWTLEGLPRLMVIGWGSSLILLWQFRSVPARPEPPHNLRLLGPQFMHLFTPLVGILFLRNFLVAGLQVYLPTYLNLKGVSLTTAGISLSIWELAGVCGVLLSGTLSDKLGRRRVLQVFFFISALLTFAFLYTPGWLTIPTLVVFGFFALSSNPVILAIVQDHFPNNRAIANGIYISMAFLILPIATIITGLIGDAFGLHTAFLGGGFATLLAIPLLWLLPDQKQKEG